jgi:hypothetical protein
MDLNDWRRLNILTMEVNIYALFIVSIICIIQYKKITGSFRLLVYYLIICSGLILLGKFFIWQNKEPDYFSAVNHLLDYFYIII